MLASLPLLSGISSVIAALIIGVVLGIILVTSDLADRVAVSTLSVIKRPATLMMLLGAAFIGVLAGTWLPPQSPESGNLWCAVAGGVLCGLGVFLAGLTPGSALAALGRGQAYGLYLLLGGSAVLIWGEKITTFCRDTLHGWGGALPETTQDALPWDISAPRFYLLLILAAIWLFVKIIWGRTSSSTDRASSSKK